MDHFLVVDDGDGYFGQHAGVPVGRRIEKFCSRSESDERVTCHGEQARDAPRKATGRTSAQSHESQCQPDGGRPAVLRSGSTDA
ncbi:hypothetical protein D3C87_1646600 [compost metagenome]